MNTEKLEHWLAEPEANANELLNVFASVVEPGLSYDEQTAYGTGVCVGIALSLYNHDLAARILATCNRELEADGGGPLDDGETLTVLERMIGPIESYLKGEAGDEA